MKLSTALILLASAAVSSATTIRKSFNAKAKLLNKSRRLEGEEEQQQEEEFSFLANYSLKLVACANGEKFQNPENGEYEYSTVIYRLCPADECDSDLAKGCKTGYGDFITGLNTFVDAWLEDKRENMNQDDQFNIDEFSECREYQAEDNGDGDNNGGNNAVYYVGPTCDDDGDIRLGFFSDYMCSTVPEDVTFEDISNGWTLPYSSGGLTGRGCESCSAYNDNGEYQVSEMCQQLYEWSGKCETNMEYTGQYGADTSKCESIELMMPASSGGASAGKIIGWLIFALVVVGVAGFAYTKWWMKKKNDQVLTAEGI